MISVYMEHFGAFGIYIVPVTSGMKSINNWTKE